MSKQVASKPEYATSSLTQNGYEHRQQQQRMCSKHRHSCHTDGQRQQQTPEGTLHTYKQTREQYIIRFLHAAAVTYSCWLIPLQLAGKKTHILDMQCHVSPMISMKICFQCSQVWKPRCRAEDCGREASCSWMKFSH